MQTLFVIKQIDSPQRQGGRVGLVSEVRDWGPSPDLSLFLCGGGQSLFRRALLPLAVKGGKRQHPWSQGLWLPAFSEFSEGSCLGNDCPEGM